MTGRDLPISFSGPMVRALLAGTKTQTRRVLSPQPSSDRRNLVGLYAPRLTAVFENPDVGSISDFTVRLRYMPGDRLYVREHWRVDDDLDHAPPRDLPTSPHNRPFLHYEADGAPTHDMGKFRQGMHMPRWASRLTLTVTDVRVERLQDCSEADALAEGIELKPYGHWKCYGDTPAPFGGAAPSVLAHGIGRVSASPIHSYATLWDSINGEGAWDANPWVAAYSFTVALGNIDQLARAA